MFCPNCGFELDGDLRYCTECGHALEDAKAVLNSAGNEVAEEPSVINEAAEEIFASDETEKEPSAGAEAGEEKSPVESEPVADEEDDRPKDDVSSDATPSIQAVRADRPKPSNPVAKPVAAPAPAPAANVSAQKKEPKALYIVGIVVGLAVIAIFSYLLFFSKSGDVAHYGQDKAIVVAQESKITPTDAKGEKIKKYSVTLNGDNGYSTNAEVKGDEGFTVSQFPDIKPGKYTLTVRDSKSKVEWGIPVKVVDNSKSTDAVKEVSLEVPKANEADTKTGEGDKKDGGAAADNTAAYAAYKQKCQEYLACYGEPRIVEATDSVYAMRGLCLADLVDFDQDGQPELLTVVNGMSDDELKSAWNGDIEGLQKSYTVEVWSAADGGVKRLYSQNWLDNSNGGTMFLPLIKADDGSILVSQRTYEISNAITTLLAGRQALAGDNTSVYGKKGDVFSLVSNYESWGVAPSEGNGYEGYYASEGKEISGTDYNALYQQFGYGHNYRTYYFLDFSTSDYGSISGESHVDPKQVAEVTKDTLKKVGIE